MRRDEDGEEQSIPVTELAIGDRIVIRKGELIPADSILLNGDGDIDYSFVTGESDPVSKESGDVIYAGGRQTGGRLGPSRGRGDNCPRHGSLVRGNQ